MVALIRPRPGDWLESAFWYNADGPEAFKEAEDKVTDSIFELAWEHKVKTKPIVWEHVTPDDPQVPSPPDWLQGTAKCAIGSAEVTGMLQMGSDFTDEIQPHELVRLRAATRVQFEKAGGLDISDNEIDEIINQFAPEVAAGRPH